MKKLTILVALAVVLIAQAVSGQVPVATQVAILKAEDARNFSALKPWLESKDGAVRLRAILAAGRIGDAAAVPAVAAAMQNDSSAEVREMAAFALGEIESIEAADAIRIALGETAKAQLPGAEKANVRGRLVEAAGKIAAVNTKDTKAKPLAEAINFILAAENTETGASRDEHSVQTIRLGITAVLRARPEGGEAAVVPFLGHSDPLVVADALNTLTRLRTKTASLQARGLLEKHADPIVRANAARLLGAAEDATAVELLIKAATTDADSRVRVSAIRSLGALKAAGAADPLIKHGDKLLNAYVKSAKPNLIPAEQSEFIEVAVALGQVIPDSFNEEALKLLRRFFDLDKGASPEPYIARVRIAPGKRPGGAGDAPELTSWKHYRTLAHIVGEFAVIEPAREDGKELKAEAPTILGPLAMAMAEIDPAEDPDTMLAAPDVLRAYARFKTDDLGEVLRTALGNTDVFIRAAAASLIADMLTSAENIEALNKAFAYSVRTDVMHNDAILGILDALVKLDPKGEAWPETMGRALISPDHLVRQKVRNIIPAELKKKTSDQLLYQVTPYIGTGTKNGQVLNTDADYRRAAMRKNGSVKAVFTTAKGNFIIDLLPEDAPLTVDNFVKLANAKYLDGLEVHRVVPNFVMQDGDPIGNGSGGPGWTIRCEINMLPYGRGAVGMALSGKDTGGSQWFVTHSPQPHLDGGYTVFGKVNETDMKVVDNIVRGDKLISVRIVGK